MGQEYASLRLMTEAPPTRLLGYFQDAALVDAAKARGFPEVLYLEEPSARALDVFREATESSVLGIHIRLRDFPQSSRLSAEQYLDALATSIMKPSERATTWIFTDDPGKIEPFMVRLSQFRPRLAPTDGLTPPEVLKAMSHCDTFVSCRSSLSFWAGSWCQAGGGNWIRAGGDFYRSNAADQTWRLHH